MSWQDSETKGYNWYKSNIDPLAVQKGMEDSTHSDIFSPKFNCYIEIKDITNGARCGQFTESTIGDNPYASEIYVNPAQADVCGFVRYHYEKKKVGYFIIIANDQLDFCSLSDFLQKYNFSIQKPYQKRSGTRVTPKKDISLLLQDEDFEMRADRVYCSNPNRWGNYYSLRNPSDYFINTNTGELRKRGTTNNMTWHIIVDNK